MGLEQRNGESVGCAGDSLGAFLAKVNSDLADTDKKFAAEHKAMEKALEVQKLADIAMIAASEARSLSRRLADVV